MIFPLKQTAAYWAPLSLDGFGQATYAAPVLVPCRWEQRREIFISDKGEQLTSSHSVYSGSELAHDGKLLLAATLNYLTSTPPAGALRIEAVLVSPNLSNSQNLYKLWLR